MKIKKLKWKLIGNASYGPIFLKGEIEGIYGGLTVFSLKKCGMDRYKFIYSIVPLFAMRSQPALCSGVVFFVSSEEYLMSELDRIYNEFVNNLIEPETNEVR